ncbi:MAG: hypothetical protein GPOALKHO_001523 [Sodalis sp.]|nr:MAG: hypothetical protein GPOALKHO_001523 [Sodalis sp.]
MSAIGPPKRLAGVDLRLCCREHDGSYRRFVGDSAAFHRLTDRAGGIDIMAAVAECTSAQIIHEFDEAASNKFRRQMLQTKFPCPREPVK